MRWLRDILRFMTGQSATPFKGQVSEELVRQLVFATNAEVQEEFKRQHGEMIERAIKGIKAAHDSLDLLRYRLKNKGDLQVAIIELFFHAAINSVLCATHFLISGYPIPAGNMMRQYTEAVAMALLCLDGASRVLERFTSDMTRFPVHEAPSMLRNKKRSEALKRLIDFNPDSWEKALGLKELYDSLSHASGLSLAHASALGTEHGMILGGEYDHDKDEKGAYAKDLRRYATGAESLAQLIDVTSTALVKMKNKP